MAIVLEDPQHRLQVRAAVANFVCPLMFIVLKNGSAIYIASCVLYIAQEAGDGLGLAQIIILMFVLLNTDWVKRTLLKQTPSISGCWCSGFAWPCPSSRAAASSSSSQSASRSTFRWSRLQLRDCLPLTGSCERNLRSCFQQSQSDRGLSLGRDRIRSFNNGYNVCFGVAIVDKLSDMFENRHEEAVEEELQKNASALEEGVISAEVKSEGETLLQEADSKSSKL